jgi:leucyl/phenylalanyl-tRNA--protein transferase
MSIGQSAARILSASDPLPDPAAARRAGLVAAGGGLSVARLREAYRKGIFPWSADPVTWWSPDPRAVIDLSRGVRVSRRLAQKLRQGRFEVSRDRAFRQVMEACGGKRAGQNSSWISPSLTQAYVALHDAGDAHSVEVWRDGHLVGGIYGVAAGGAFAGESMFHHETDVSKIALVSLADHLRRRGFLLFDVQVANPFTRQMGAEEIPRREFLGRLRKALAADAAF